ncbi:DUF1801 domain-containing protein [Qipengyuania soli]|uniref:DUF1801 domain-containing protein n=2 Tax=Qipengyuania soli TaxID=2782568 RepID=A0A7S8IVN6_9SPHN|nr:DUF1801 domain-containing protein [Qipengyuania soli]
MAQLREIIDQVLPEAESKIWHAHPVWFLDGNPVVGYSQLKGVVRLLFWSGQSFSSAGLEPSGSFKAAECRYSNAADIDHHALREWLAESRSTQWDYKNIVKRRGKLERLC